MFQYFKRQDLVEIYYSSPDSRIMVGNKISQKIRNCKKKKSEPQLWGDIKGIQEPTEKGYEWSNVDMYQQNI